MLCLGIYLKIKKLKKKPCTHTFIFWFKPSEGPKGFSNWFFKILAHGSWTIKVGPWRKTILHVFCFLSNLVSFRKWTHVFGSSSAVQLLWFGGWVTCDDLVSSLVIFGFSHLCKSQTTPTILDNEELFTELWHASLLCPRWANQEATCDYEVPTNLYRGYSIMRKTIWQHFVLDGTTLETWHNQYWHPTCFSFTNDPCRIYYWCCPLTQHWTIKRFPRITPH